MYPFVETIRISNGEAENLPYHEARMNHTRREVLKSHNPLFLEALLKAECVETHGIYKCRIEYRESIEKVELIPYAAPVIRNLMMIEADTLRYSHKSTDRAELNRIHAQATGCSDALIIQHGLVTDTTFCNVAFFDGYNWITPASPLLKGTKRAQLINQGMLIERNIPACMVKEFKLIMLFNAMNEFGTIILPTHEIYRIEE